MLVAKIDTPGLDALRRRMSQAPVIVQEELRAGLTTASSIATEEVRLRAPGSGGLRAAIQPVYRGDRLEGGVGVAPGRYQAISRYQETGTGIHGPARRHYVIEPRTARVLRFRVGGSVVFARRVIHPGVKPHWMFRDGMAAARPRIVRVYAARMGNVTRRLGRR